MLQVGNSKMPYNWEVASDYSNSPFMAKNTGISSFFDVTSVGANSDADFNLIWLRTTEVAR